MPHASLSLGGVEDGHLGEAVGDTPRPFHSGALRVTDVRRGTGKASHHGATSAPHNSNENKNKSSSCPTCAAGGVPALLARIAALEAENAALKLACPTTPPTQDLGKATMTASTDVPYEDMAVAANKTIAALRRPSRPSRHESPTKHDVPRTGHDDESEQARDS
jgi:hypothetical protein